MALRAGAGAIAGREVSPAPSQPDRLAVALCQAQMLALQYGDETAAQQMRGQIGFYSRGLPNAAWLRQRCQQVRSLGQLAQVVQEYLTLHQ